MSNKDGHCIWIRVKDFEQISLCISIENTVTRTSVGENAQVELTQLEENGCSLKLPSKSCALGHMLSMTVKRKVEQPFQPNDENYVYPEIHATGKVVSLEKLDGDSSVAVLKFNQVDQKAWKSFLSSLEQRQEKIDLQLKKIQG